MEIRLAAMEGLNVEIREHMLEIRLAAMEDLPELKQMYQAIIEDMQRRNLQIWDEIYPCECLEGDIRKNHLYLLEDCQNLACAFALCPSHAGSQSVEWEDNSAKAFYIDRLGVDARHSRKGVGGIALKQAARLARGQGAEYIRLFVVEENDPAIYFYEKQGFRKAEGIYIEEACEGFTLREIGYEKSVAGCLGN